MQQPDVVVNPCDDKINGQRTKKLWAMVEKPHKANKSTSSTELDNSPQKKMFDENQLIITSNETCNEGAISKPEADVDGELIASTETASSGGLSQKPLLSCDLEAVERGIYLLTKLLNIPTNTVSNTVVDSHISILGEIYSELTTPPVPTVSPIVTDDAEDNFTHGENSSFRRSVDDKFI